MCFIDLVDFSGIDDSTDLTSSKSTQVVTEAHRLEIEGSIIEPVIRSTNTRMTACNVEAEQTETFPQRPAETHMIFALQSIVRQLVKKSSARDGAAVPAILGRNVYYHPYLILCLGPFQAYLG